MSKQKHAHQVTQTPYQHLFLTLGIIVIVLLGGLMLTLTATQYRTRQLTLSPPTQQITLAWRYTYMPDDTFLDAHFSPISTHYYALTDSQVLEYQDFAVTRTLTLPDDVTPHTFVVHPNGNEIAIGAVQDIDETIIHKQGLILTIDVESFEITQQLSSGASYNFGHSKTITYSPDGDALYHLYNLNNAGCGRTFDILEHWNIASATYETITLPTSYASNLVVSDEMLTVQVHTSCIPMGNGTRLVMLNNEGELASFPTDSNTIYRNLQHASAQNLFLASLDSEQPPFQSTLHTWQDTDLSQTIELDQRVQGMALSPDVSLIALTVARNTIPIEIGQEPTDIELHIFDRDINRVTLSLNLNTLTPIQQVSFNVDGTRLLLRNADQLAILPLE